MDFFGLVSQWGISVPCERSVEVPHYWGCIQIRYFHSTVALCSASSGLSQWVHEQSGKGARDESPAWTQQHRCPFTKLSWLLSLSVQVVCSSIVRTSICCHTLGLQSHRSHLAACWKSWTFLLQLGQQFVLSGMDTFLDLNWIPLHHLCQSHYPWNLLNTLFKVMYSIPKLILIKKLINNKRSNAVNWCPLDSLVLPCTPSPQSSCPYRLLKTQLCPQLRDTLPNSVAPCAWPLGCKFPRSVSLDYI